MTASGNDDTTSKRTNSSESGEIVGEISNAEHGDPPAPGATVRDILSERPFPRAVRLWRDKGWTGTIPLPAKAKFPPPTGWTGFHAKFPDNAQISEWAKDKDYRKGNIGLHLGFPVLVNGREFEIVGIDVDHYDDLGAKPKRGFDTLTRLEAELGPLPRTWVSTARAQAGDFKSGIRFFLVPPKLEFAGNAGGSKGDIDVIQKKHRFAVVWPSYNPKADRQYMLYSPEQWANGVANGSAIPSTEIPHVSELPELPKKWLDSLTSFGMELSALDIDMDSSPKEMEEWAEEQFNEPDTMCSYVSKALAKWKKRVDEDSSSHDKIRDGSWELANLAAEGHTGWSEAINQFDEHWLNDVMIEQGGKGRTMSDVRREVWRQKINAFRKVKAKIANATSAGGVYTPDKCPCNIRAAIAQTGGVVATMGGNAGGLFVTDDDLDTDNDGASPPDGLDHVSWGRVNSPDEYEMNDDGNGEFLMDLLRYRSGRVKWIEGYGWIVWTDGEPGRPSRWLHDQDGLIRRALWRVKRMQAAFADQKREEAEQAWQNANGGVTPMPAAVKAMFMIAKKWDAWALRTGNNMPANAAIDAAKNMPGVRLDINELNQNPYLLGVANGVVELRRDGAMLREAEAKDYVTLNTNTQWETYSGIPAHDIGKKMWEEYLDRFVPENRREAYQIIFGHCIVGGNPERLMLILLGGTSTGKSTMLRALGAALGDYSTTVNLTIFENHKLNPALANAMPKRMVFTSELSAGDSLSVSTVKRMTGNDHVKAELKGVNVEVEGIPQYVPIMATNTAPEIMGADEALRRRLMALLFDQRIDDRKDEKRASQQLEEHASEAILAWLIEGYVKYCQFGIPQNLEITQATNEFSAQLDPVSEFVGECVRPSGMDVHVSVDAMYRAYKSWCDHSGIDRREIVSSQKLARRLVGLGMVQKRASIDKKQVRAWAGVMLTRKAELRNQSVMSVPDIKLITESEDKKANGDNGNKKGNDK